MSETPRRWISRPWVLPLGAALAIALLLAAAPARSGAPPDDADDADEADLEELLEADRAFARLSEEEGMVAAFAEYLAEDALMLPNGGPPVQGREKILEIFSGGPPTELHWEPRGGLVADSGELGTTWGSYRATVTGPGGSKTVGHGKYLNVWRKGPDGAWKVIVDMGNTNPPPAPEPEAEADDGSRG